MALVVAFAGMLRWLAPEELEKTRVATAHVVYAHGGFLEALDGLRDHVTDEGAFFFRHCGRASGLGDVRTWKNRSMVGGGGPGGREE